MTTCDQSKPFCKEPNIACDKSCYADVSDEYEENASWAKEMVVMTWKLPFMQDLTLGA